MTGKLNSLQEEIVDTIGGYQLLPPAVRTSRDKLKAMLKEEVEEKGAEGGEGPSCSNCATS